MSRERDPLAPDPHWRVDLRLVAELAEDNVIGTRFLVNVIFSAVAVIALIYCGWLGYQDFSLRHQIRDWDQRVKDNAAEVREIQDMQKKYAMEAAKVDQAWTLIRPQLRVHAFLTNLGRTRPEQLVIDIVDWNENGIVVRGNLRESSDRATSTLTNYVRLLNADEKINSVFNVKEGDLLRDPSGALFKFEITFRFRAAKP